MHLPDLADLLHRHRIRTPALIIDRRVVRERYRLLRERLPQADVYFSVKANSEPRILELLCGMGSSFEAASIDEVRACIRAGAHPGRIHFGNPIKLRGDVRRAFRLGVRSFAIDSESELEKLALEAAGATAIARLSTDGRGAVWGLTRKYGTDATRAAQLLLQAREAGLVAGGVSFHVGSQQSDPDAWRVALDNARIVVELLAAHGLRLPVINLGGGLPANGYTVDAQIAHYDFADYLDRVRGHLEAFLDSLPYACKVIIEPGRFLVANAGAVVSKVVLGARRQSGDDDQRWLYLDVGKFNGLYEATDIQLPFYPVRLARRRGARSGECVRTILAGPTCDSDDVLLPSGISTELDSDIDEGDLIVFPVAGAYSTSYATMSFNGFRPMDVHCLEDFSTAPPRARAEPVSAPIPD